MTVRKMIQILPSCNISFITNLAFCMIIGLHVSGCSTTSNNSSSNSNTNWSRVHKISIVNSSKKFINSVHYKPCGADDNQYSYLVGNIKPREKLTINIHTQCIDLMATNAFKKKLVGVENVDLNAVRTWTIK